ncbi:MAG: hypothetical protein JW892_03450 [Anaerolineae bacterium]|nr:hypothetical protein [Anaerolineae bacterium]
MMQKRLRAVLLGAVLAGFIAGWGCAEGAVTAPLPPETHWALAPGGAASEWQVYLTGSDISGLALDGDVLWAASNGGLLRWERATGSVVQYLAPAFPLPGNSLSQVLLHAGQLYISGKGGVAIFDRQEQWTLYTEADIGMPIGYHAPIAMVEESLWVVGENGLAVLFPDGHWETTLYGQDTLPDYPISRIWLQDSKVMIVVALGPTVDDERRIFRLNDGVWQAVDDLSLQYLQTPAGVLWKAGHGELRKSTDGGLTWTTVLAGGSVFPLLVDAEGRLFVADDDTILVLENDVIVESYDFTAAGPELNFINILQWDASGRLWIATDGRGLTLFDGENWLNWQDGNAGMREDCIRGMALGDGQLYAGTHSSAGTGGVNVLDLATLTWTNLWPGESELSGGGVDGIAVDGQGRVYFPTAAGVLDIYDHGSWEHHVIPALPSSHIFGFSEAVLDPYGIYWVGIDGFGLYRYDGQNWTWFDLPGDVTALALDSVNRLWVGTTAGLLVRDVDHRWFTYGADVLPAETPWLTDIALDAAGRAWMITRQDLLVFNGQEWRAPFSPEVVGASMWGDALALDAAGHVWVATDWGLAEYRGALDLAGFAGLESATWVQDEAEIAQELDENSVSPFESPYPLPAPTSPTASVVVLVLGMLCGGCGCTAVGIILVVMLVQVWRKPTPAAEN